jgi:hypothetical protein
VPVTDAFAPAINQCLGFIVDEPFGFTGKSPTPLNAKQRAVNSLNRRSGWMVHVCPFNGGDLIVGIRHGRAEASRQLTQSCRARCALTPRVRG